MWTLRGAVQSYGWGSRTVLPEFLGIDPDGHPLAELWFGAHAAAPALAVRAGPAAAGAHGVDAAPTLADLIARHPHEILGCRVRQEVGDRMPFLVKLLAIERSLSIQVHPDAAGARAGGVPDSAPRQAAPDRSDAPDPPQPQTLHAQRPPPPP
ncbi:MAG: type I phosphomannose isomerase catalytic subunit, partial [Cellulomonadaceae bacterium]